MAIRTRAELLARITSLFPDNILWEISAADLRDMLTDVVDTLADDALKPLPVPWYMLFTTTAASPTPAQFLADAYSADSVLERITTAAPAENSYIHLATPESAGVPTVVRPVGSFNFRNSFTPTISGTQDEIVINNVAYYRYKTVNVFVPFALDGIWEVGF